MWTLGASNIEYMSGLKLSDETDLMGKKHEANPVSALQF